jgi:hypothetical protein
LERPFFEKISAETVDGSDMGFLELGETFLESVSSFTLSVTPLLFELGAETELELTRRFLCERDGDEAGELSAPASDHFDDASYQGGGFAGPRGRFHDERFVESTTDALPRLVIIQVNIHKKNSTQRRKENTKKRG